MDLWITSKKRESATRETTDQKVSHDLEQGCRQLQGYRHQIVLRELQTLSGHPERLHEWTRAAIEMATKYASGRVQSPG